MDALNQEFLRLFAVSGWNQARVSRELHVSSGTVSQYVSGETRPSLTVLRLLAELVGDTLRVPGVTPAPANRTFPPRLDPRERALVDALRDCPSEQRRQLLEAFATICRTTRPKSSGPPSA